MAIDLNRATALFERYFITRPEWAARAPGRVNIIGEHTDYNHGFVLPMAIEHETVILARKTTRRTIRAVAANLQCFARIDLDNLGRNPAEPWQDYIAGVAHELNALDLPLTGADILILGDVPIGCGLSSSASLEMAALKMFETLGGFLVEGAEAPKLGRRVENDFLGLSTGIMDQFISRMGKAGHALFLDCRSYTFETIPVLFPDAVFVIGNTCVARGLTSSKYNERVEQCAEAVRALCQSTGKDGSHLRDFTLEELESARYAMDPIAYRRARHVITEDVRTQEACEAMQQGDAVRLGALMTGSDNSLREDYEVTCPELDAMTSIARGIDGCLGARMTGAGFGGCTIHLVQADAVASFTQELLAAYESRTGIRGETFVSLPAEGASAIPISG